MFFAFFLTQLGEIHRTSPVSVPVYKCVCCVSDLISTRGFLIERVILSSDEILLCSRVKTDVSFQVRNAEGVRCIDTRL